MRDSFRTTSYLICLTCFKIETLRFKPVPFALGWSLESVPVTCPERAYILSPAENSEDRCISAKSLCLSVCIVFTTLPHTS